MTMRQTRYLVVGSSHAAIEAVSAIRMHDAEGSLTVATRDRHLPYSPTVLPYVVSGRSSSAQVLLRDAAYFAERNIDYRQGQALVAVRPTEHVAQLDGAAGGELRYEKLLLATGASPIVSPIPGIEKVEYHVLRTLDDAVGLNRAIGTARRAVVLGAGLVGMHAAENLAKAGANVTIVEMADQLCAGYFDRTAATLIEKAFTDHGATIRTGRRVVGLAPSGHGAILTLDTGDSLEADLLLVATGVRPELGYLANSGILADKGILVDDSMQTNVADVWAAGDCAQARSFYSDAKVMNAILPAVKGRIAGMAMAGDPDQTLPGRCRSTPTIFSAVTPFRSETAGSLSRWKPALTKRPAVISELVFSMAGWSVFMASTSSSTVASWHN
jgi:phenylglyoxylate dehydrogenase epsilon subunit